MRADAALFAQKNLAPQKEPRFVVNIVYTVSSLYVTSHTGISGVPGTVIDGALIEPSITSQTINPDEASSQIGSASFQFADIGSGFTTAVQSQLGSNGEGLRNRIVRFYLGYAGLAFSDFVLIGTQMVTGASYKDGAYNVSCNDLQRTLKKEIFVTVQTTLSASITATATTITLTTTTGLARVAHGTGWTDAPSSTVGYVKIGDEIIRYTGISGSDLTGCTRGALGTLARAFTVDGATPADRREKVTEYVYLELPAIKLAYALLTGVIHGTANVLPAGWHLGVDTSFITLAEFTGIGTDLWDTSDDTKGFALRFEGLSKTDGKGFIEKEIYLIAGVFSPVKANGTLGLRKMTRVIQGAAPVVTLNETNSIQVGELEHDFSSMHNDFAINWSYNGKEFRRTTRFIDAISIGKHGRSPLYERSFKGLFGGLHTDGIIFSRLDSIRDRYAAPPLRLNVELLHSLNTLEIGDIVQVQYAHVRDFSQSGTSINRSFEIQNISVNHRTGRVSLELFGSTAVSSVNSATAAATALPDAFYNATGTALSTAIGAALSGNAIVSNCSLSSGTYFHLANLTINAGVVVTIAGTVQLRVRGFLQVNGTISGIGGGMAGVADTGQTLTLFDQTNPDAIQTDVIAGTPGYFGNSRGYDGVDVRQRFKAGFVSASTRTCALVQGANQVTPFLTLKVSGTTLQGVPADLRGSGGAPGGRGGNASATVLPAHYGGAGAAGGAGLSIICRGMALGAAAIIDLSGAGTTPTTETSIFTVRHFPGAGGGGAPGACYILLDGSGLSVPDLGTKFRAFCGVVPVSGNAMPSKLAATDEVRGAPPGTFGQLPDQPIGGFRDPQFISGLDMSGSALRIQYVPAVEAATADLSTAPPPLTSLTTTARIGGVNVFLGVPPFVGWDVVQVFGSTINDRTTAVIEFEGLAALFVDRYTPSITKYYWARTKLTTSDGNFFSTFFPVSATAGVVGTPISNKFFSTSNTFASDTTFFRSSGTGFGTSAVRSIDGFSSCHLQFKADQTNLNRVFGLTTDPNVDDDWTSIDYGFNPNQLADIRVVESGVEKSGSPYGTYTAGDIFSILYEGTLITYLVNNVVIATTTVASGLTLYAKCAFNQNNNGVSSISWGNGSAQEFFSVGTIEIAEEAATTTAFATGINITAAGFGGNFDLNMPSENTDTTYAAILNGLIDNSAGPAVCRVGIDIYFTPPGGGVNIVVGLLVEVAAGQKMYVARLNSYDVPANSTAVKARVVYSTFSTSCGSLIDANLKVEAIKR